MLRDIQSRIYFITPAETTDSKQILGLVQAAVRSGVGMIQYRAKHQTTRVMIEQARALLKITRPAQVPLIINDRVDVALAVGADGVHVGQEDMAPNDARRLMGPHAIVGVTAPELAVARQAEYAAANYVSCGPIFASPTKPEKPPVGIEHLQRLQQAVSVPVCAIGGINEETIVGLADASPTLIAVGSAISQADDPAAAARRLVEIAAEAIPHISFGP